MVQSPPPPPGPLFIPLSYLHILIMQFFLHPLYFDYWSCLRHPVQFINELFIS